MLSFILSILLLGGVSVLGDNIIRISNVDDFIELSDSVNTLGSSYDGFTILIDSDLDFTGKTVEPIGNSSSIYFAGTINGQGHTISNLVMNTTSEYVGLVGLSLGPSNIKNVVTDASCFFGGVGNPVAGSIIGACIAYEGACDIENSVNLGSVTTYVGSEPASVSVGGIAGQMSYLDPNGKGYDSTIKNCANYGTVNHFGTVPSIFIGGLVGYSYSIYVINSLNAGELIFDGNAQTGCLGGLFGYNEFSVIKLSIHAGDLLPSSPLIVGSFGGYVINSQFDYSYWDDDHSYDAFGYRKGVTLIECAKFEHLAFNQTVRVDEFEATTLAEFFTTYGDVMEYNGYNGWLLNNDRKNVTFKVSGNKPFTLKSNVILLPTFVDEERLCFDGWYTDSPCTTKLSSSVIAENLELYGKYGENYNEYTITFDADGGSPAPEPVKAQYLSFFGLPQGLVKGYYVLAFWTDKYGDPVDWNYTVPAGNTTLYPIWLPTRITSGEEFVHFANVMSTGYADTVGLTVYLDSDINLDGEIVSPINLFFGTFDGQGHVIDNVIIGSSMGFTGLFGLSLGMSVKNVVLGSSAIVMSASTRTTMDRVGGIVGYCSTYYDMCSIENSVNLGVTYYYSGAVQALYLGGIAGSLEYNQYISVVKNCANYNQVISAGTAGSVAIGGIVGGADSTFIQNCLNAGSIGFDSSKLEETFVGGIVGFSQLSLYENCLNLISVQAAEVGFTGNIAGADFDSVINISFWTSSNTYSAYGYGNGTVIAETGRAILASTLTNKLNEYSEENVLNGWLLNLAKSSVSFKIGNRAGFVLKSEVILLPDPVDNIAFAFDGWYENEELTTKFTANEVNSATFLYGRWFAIEYFVTLNFGNGTTAEKAFAYGDTIVYPDNVERTGYAFGGWFEDRLLTKKFEGTIVTGDITIYAKWTLLQYTVTFNLGNGTSLNEVFNYGATIVCPQGIERTGYTFDGWFEDSSFTKQFEGATATKDITLYAKWTLLQYTVTFDFGNGTVDEETLNHGAEIAYPDNTDRTGHVFGGWFEDENFETAFEETIATRDIIIYGKWTLLQCTVTFDYGDGSTTVKTLEYGDQIPFPVGTEKKGYTFVGWFEDSAFTKQFEETTVTGDVTIYAKYVANQPIGGDDSSSSSNNHASFSFRTTPLLAFLSMLF